VTVVSAQSPSAAVRPAKDVGHGISCVVHFHPATRQRRAYKWVVCSNTGGPQGPRGATGPQGPPGPAGTPGASGVSSSDINIPRTTIPLTTGFMTDGGNVQNLATVGPIHVDGLCRQTSSNGSGNGAGLNAHYPAPFVTMGGETEAQVLVWSETGSLSFRGGAGPRVNIPPGPPNYSAIEGTAGSATGDPVAGEGSHLFVAASNERTDETRATDPQVDNYANSAPGGAGGLARQLKRYPGFNTSAQNDGSGIVTTSDGHMVVATLLAGFDTFGVYDACVFAGDVQPLF
jgi:hypothetical protein